MKQVTEAIQSAQIRFKELLTNGEGDGGLHKERYARFLTMQYHLTKGVQKHFMAIAAHSTTAKRPALRRWLVNFSQEEEFHFEIAKADLKQLGLEPGECPLDTKLWWLYFGNIIDARPFARMGAACILENIAGTSGEVLDRMIGASTYLNPKNLRFLTIHRHGPNLDHGNQIVKILTEADLNSDEMQDVLHGTEVATCMYLRFMHWIMTKELK